jgi:chaperonin GroEL
MLLTTECVLADEPEEDKGHGHPPMGGGMGGMM